MRRKLLFEIFILELLELIIETLNIFIIIIFQIIHLIIHLLYIIINFIMSYQILYNYFI